MTTSWTQMRAEYLLLRDISIIVEMELCAHHLRQQYKPRVTRRAAGSAIALLLAHTWCGFAKLLPSRSDLASSSASRASCQYQHYGKTNTNSSSSSLSAFTWSLVCGLCGRPESRIKGARAHDFCSRLDVCMRLVFQLACPCTNDCPLSQEVWIVSREKCMPKICCDCRSCKLQSAHTAFRTYT